MEIVTSWMEKGIEKGRAEGEVEGRKQERLALVLRLLRRQLGDISSQFVTQVEALSVEQLDVLFDAALYFQSQADLVQWLEENG